jgi:hypothetical protein
MENVESSGCNAEPSDPKRKVSNKRFRRILASWSRWLHIYLSMLGLAVILFFSVTGLTLNHPDWFFSEHTSHATGEIRSDWLNTGAAPPAGWDEYDFSHEIEKLEIAEFLREEHGLRGKVSDFLAFEDECELTFQGPGYVAIARLKRNTGNYTVDVTTSDLVTVINDLHKGRHTGHNWSLVIDLSAVIGTLVAITGFALIFFLRSRRVKGLIVFAAGSFLFLVMYYIATR